MPKMRTLVLTAVAILAGAGSASAFWFITDMFDQVSKKPQEGTPMHTPADSVPADGGTYPIDLPRAELVKILPENPYGARATSEEVRAAGKVLFERNCAICHGLTGMGDGPVAAAGKGIPPFPLIGAAAAYPDQLLFAQIWVGNNAIMGPYYWAMSPDEVWQVVSYLRKLAGK